MEIKTLEELRKAIHQICADSYDEYLRASHTSEKIVKIWSYGNDTKNH